MPTPVGPVPPDPKDPDMWDWGEDEEDFPRYRQRWRLVLVGVIVAALIILVIASTL